MTPFKLTLASVLVAQVIAGYVAAANHDVSADGVIAADTTFAGSDVVTANAAGSFQPNTQTTFTEQSSLNASKENAVNAGQQNFRDTASLVIGASNAVSGGVQNFRDSSHLQVRAANGISGGRQNFYDDGKVSLQGVDLISNNIAFNLLDIKTTFTLAGQKALLGLLEGKGKVVNDSNNNGTLTLDTSKWGASTFDGVLADGTGSGKLSLIKQGSGEWIFNGDGSGMTGTTTVDGGQLTVNGDLSNSSMTVNAGGTLAGGGTVGTVDVKASGVLGTEKITDRLKVNGDLTFAKLGTLYTSVGADGQAGVVEVKGKASLNDAYVYVAAGAGTYSPNTRYSILTADGGVSGTFDSARNTLYFLVPKLIYHTNSVELELERNDKTIVSAAQSPSAISVASNLDRNSNTLVNHLLTSDLTTASHALEQLAGAASASRVAAMLASTAQVGNSMLKAMEQQDSRGNSLQAAVLRSDAPLLVSNQVPAAARGLHDPHSEGRVWLQALGTQGTFESASTAGDLQQRSSGGLLGADWAVSDAWRMGIASGYSKTDLQAGEYQNGAVKSYHLGVYGWHHNGPLATRMGFAYSGHDGSSKRQVNFNQFRDTPRGSFDASGQQAFVEFAYQSANGQMLKEPFFNLGYQRYQRDAYTEKGGAAALYVDDQQQSNLSSTLGFRVASLRQLDNGISLTPRGSVGWRRTYGDTDVSTSQAFLSGGSNFDVYGSSLDRDSLVLEGGLDLGFGTSQSLGLGYTGNVGSNGRNHGWQAQWRLSF